MVITVLPVVQCVIGVKRKVGIPRCLDQEHVRMGPPGSVRRGVVAHAGLLVNHVVLVKNTAKEEIVVVGKEKESAIYRKDSVV